MGKVFELPKEARATCAFCLRAATHFIIHIPSHGEILALCPKDAEKRMAA